MVRTLAAAAAAAVAVGALGGCTSSGGTAAPPTPSSPAPTSSMPSSSIPPPSSSASSGSPTRTSTPPSHSLTAIAPIRPLTCATLPHSLGRFRPGGSLPSGVPLPQAVPRVTCAGKHGAVAVVWTTVSEAQYRQELVGTGWAAPGAAPIFTKPHAPRTIQLGSVHGALIAVYRPT